MAEETQYFDFSAAKDPMAGIKPGTLASLVPKTPGNPRIDLMKDTCTIGRTNETDIAIPHRNVSKRHSQLSRDGSMWEVSDIGSTNGTFVNGVRITSPVLISPRDVVSFGDQAYDFIVHDPSAAPAAAAPAMSNTPSDDAIPAPEPPKQGMTAMFNSFFAGGSQPGAPAGGPPASSSSGRGAHTSAPAAPPADDNRTMMRSYNVADFKETKCYAKLLEKALTVREYPLAQLRNRIGTAVSNDVKLTDRSIRPEHAEITFERDGRIRVRVLENDLVMKVNGEPLKIQYLKDLDTIQLGEVVFTFKLVQLPELAEFEEISPRKSASPVMLGLMLLVLLALAGGGVYVFAPQLLEPILGKPEPVAGAGTTGSDGQVVVAATPTPMVQERNEIDVVSSLLDKAQLVEARDRARELDSSQEGVEELKLAIEIAINTDGALNADDVLKARREMTRLSKESAYYNSPTFLKIRNRLEFAQEKKAAESYDRAVREYASNRFSESATFFQQADDVLPGFKDAIAQRKRASLALEASAAIATAEEAIKAVVLPGSAADRPKLPERVAEFERAEKTLETVLQVFETNKNDPKVADVITRFETNIRDRYELARLRRLYLQGKGLEALEAHAKMSEAFRADERLDVVAERIKNVHTLTTEAVAEESLGKAQQAVNLESDPDNVYRETAQGLVDRLGSRQRSQAEQFLATGREFYGKQDWVQATAAYWRARQIDPTWDEAVKAHDDAANKVLIQSVRLPEGEQFRGKKIELFRWVLDNSAPEDRVHKVADTRLRALAP